MSGPLHIELDALNDFLVDGAGRPLQIVVDRPLKPANRRLMDSLGVEVRVTATAGGVSCLVGGCEWRFDGDYDERAAAIEKHREEEHDYIPAHRFSVRSDAGRDALDAMDSLLTQREHLDVDDQADDDEDDDDVDDDIGLEAELDEVGGAEVGNREEDAAASTSPDGEETASAGQHGRSRAERVRVGAPDKSWSRKHITREAAIEGLQTAARELGFTPTMWQYRKHGYRPYNAAIVRLLGSWEAACEAADLPAPPTPTSGVKVWSRDTIIAWLREQYDKDGDVPKADYLRGPGAPPLSTINREFGSYPDAVTAAGLEPRARGGQPGNRNRSSRSSVQEPQAREAGVLSSPPPVDAKQPGATGDVAVRDQSPSPAPAAEAGSSTDEPPSAELLDMRTLVDEPGEWIHRLEAEGDRLLAESDRLARRAEGVHAIVHGLLIVQATDR